MATLELFHGAEGAAENPASKARAKCLGRAEREIAADLFRRAATSTDTTIADVARSTCNAETIMRDVANGRRGLHVEKVLRLPKRMALAYLDALRAHIEGSAPRPAIPVVNRALRASVKVNEAGALVLAAKAPNSPGGSAIVAEERVPIVQTAQRAIEELLALVADVGGGR